MKCLQKATFENGTTRGFLIRFPGPRSKVVPEGGRSKVARPISAPTLVIWGDPDSYLGSDLAEPDRDDVPNLDRVERLADGSHWVHHDEAERVNQLLIDFFGA